MEHFSCGIDTILFIFRTALYFCPKREGLLNDLDNHFLTVREHNICHERNKIWDKINDFMSEKNWKKIKGTRKLEMFDFFWKVFREYFKFEIVMKCDRHDHTSRHHSHIFIYGKNDHEKYENDISRFIADMITKKVKWCDNKLAECQIHYDDLLCVQFINHPLSIKLNDNSHCLKLNQVHSFKLIGVIYNNNNDHWFCSVTNETGFYHVDLKSFSKLDDLQKAPHDD